MDFYNILEVDHCASSIEIKKSYRRLAKTHHPDKNNGVYNDVKIKNINLAYEILSDEKLKRDYDKTLYKNDKPYDLIQNIIKKNKLEIINHLFDYIYDDKNNLKKDINDLNIKNMFEKVKNKVNLDIKSEIRIELSDIYFNKKINLDIKRSINKILLNYSMDIDIDIYDAELLYENLGDEILFIKGDLILIPKIIYDDKIFCILDKYNLLVNIDNLNYMMFDKINLLNLNRDIYFANDEFTIFIVKGYGFLNEKTNKNGDLFIKINNIYI